jgi:Holliday junction DNA helicase RuvA
MIGYLQGQLITKQSLELLVDVNGVGYEVYVSMNTTYKLPEVGQVVALYTHLIVREDAQILYGFYDQQERALFRKLIKVNGVGPRIALAILSSVNPDEFVQSVTNNHVTTLTCIPGVGQKTAERLIVEMRDKFKTWQSEPGDLCGMNSSDRIKQDATSALVALGYKSSEAVKMISRIFEVGMSSEDLIRLALKEIVGS